MLVGALKTHPTGKFTIVAKYGGGVLCRLPSSLSTVIRKVARQAGRQAGRRNFEF